MSLSKSLYDALQRHYEAKHSKAKFQLDLAFRRSVAIGDHPQIVDDSIKLIDEMAAAEEALTVLTKHYGRYND
tara:strand:- start:3234 stop:3452 length:219 start_codon:yes stop_codon:yes gene_type:complete